MARVKKNNTADSNANSSQEPISKEVESTKTKTTAKNGKDTKATTKPRTKKSPEKPKPTVVVETDNNLVTQEPMLEPSITKEAVPVEPAKPAKPDKPVKTVESGEAVEALKPGTDSVVSEPNNELGWAIARSVKDDEKGFRFQLSKLAKSVKLPKFSNLLDAEGKLFGLINPVDLVVILFIFILGIKVLADYRPLPLKVNEDQITVGFVVRNIPPYLEQSVTVGQLLFDEETNTFLGKITSKSNKTAEVVLQDGGQLILSRHPQNVDLRLVVTRKGEVITGQSKNGVYLGKLPIRIGDKLKIQTLYSTLEGEVESLDVVSKR
ncbi:MAG TPA: DUF4330 family protein [Bacillota bacterium]|jgi:hypothetical protein|nr:DUF4330 family protein [Bacillota bacterium]HOL08778.1 DUF4330 family protein [Bacillota bacterium]HPO96868.1 DUF4330 family protein [Bacillota bacterium]